MSLANNQLFYAMGNQSEDGFFVYNLSKGSFTYYNNGFIELCNIASEQLDFCPKILLDIVHPEDVAHVLACYDECLAEQTTKKYEFRIIINQKEKFVRITVACLKDSYELILCGTLEDKTIDRQNKIHIEQINAHKNIMLEVLSHDLKEPLGMIRLAASALETEIASKGSINMINSLSFIKEMCERNIKLVRSLINKEFVKSSVVKLKKERTEIVWELEDLLRFYRRSHLREIKNFRFNSSHEKIHLMLDTMKFLQVINNLISNAIKFTALNGVIELAVINKENSVIFTVADDGIGIADELKPNLFSIESRNLKLGLIGENSGGLGMNIIKTIVELHNGKIWFESEKGKGSKFYIEIPKE